MRNRHLGAILVIVALVAVAGLVGFAGNGDDEPTDRQAYATDDTADSVATADDHDTTADATDEEAAPAEEADSDSMELSADEDQTGDADSQEFVANRQLVHSGQVEVLVDDVPAVSTEIRETTAEQGGFVSSSTQQVHEVDNETWTTETLVIRVPSETFDESMNSFETYGEVQAFETETEDVTDQLVDIDARLENLRMERDRLRDLFEDANETRDVLAVQDELSSVQQEIERLDAQKQELEGQVSYSTITVHLTEEEPEPESPPEDPAWYETSVAGAFFDSVDGVVLTIRALVVGVATAAPYALAFGVPALIAVGLYRHRT